MGLRQFINRDIDFQNETKRGVVSVRILYIVTMIAFVLDLTFAGFPVIEKFPYRIALIFVAIIILFVNTYYLNTRTTIVLYLLFTFTFSLAMIP